MVKGIEIFENIISSFELNNADPLVSIASKKNIEKLKYLEQMKNKKDDKNAILKYYNNRLQRLKHNLKEAKYEQEQNLVSISSQFINNTTQASIY